MLSASQALDSIVKDMKLMYANQAHEAALSTNRPWVSATGQKIKRDSPSHVPSEGEHPETYFSLSERTLHNLATVIKVRRIKMEGREPDEWAVRRKAALNERGVGPVELAFLFGYASDKPCRELRIRNGYNEHTGFPLKGDERPITNRRR